MGVVNIKKEKKIMIRTEKYGLTRKQRTENDKKSRIPDSSPVLIILYMLGLYGMTAIGARLLSLSDSPLYMLTIAGVEALSLLLWYIYVYKNKYFMYLILIFCCITMMMIVPSWDNITASFASGQNTNDALGATLPAIVLMVSLLLFYLEFVLRRHSVLFLLCLGLVVLSPIAGVSIDIPEVVLTVIFQFGFYVFNTDISFRRNRLSVKNNSHTRAVSTTAVAVLLLIAFVPSFITQYIFEDDINYQVYTADAWLQDGINNVLGNYSTNMSDGSVSRGNLRQSGNPVFDIQTEEKPGDTLYLKGFVGNNYDGSKWLDTYTGLNMVFDYYTDTGAERRWYDTYYKEPYVYRMEEEIINRYCTDYLDVLSRDVGFRLETLETDSIGGTTVYCFDKNGREVAVTNGMIYDLFMNMPGLTTSDFDTGHLIPVAYVFREGERTVLKGDRLEEAIEKYHVSAEDPSYEENGIISDFIILDPNEYPSFPSILEMTRRSEALSDIYTEFGRSGALYSEEDHAVGLFGSLNDENNFRITPVNQSGNNVLYPYYPSYGNGYGALGNGDGRTSRFYESSYLYSDTVTMKDKWNSVPSYYEQFIDLYEDRTYDFYTEYDDGRFPRLSQLCRENSSELESLNEITTFILYTLQTQARYSKTPGSVPFNTETVEYFLFDNHQGYCVHFATTAAIMYRMLGIPARYVTGYAVSSGLFEDHKNGNYNYKATVSDISAHAWVEIFLKDYGWVPVEVTPTLDGRMRASYPGYSEAVMNNIMKAKGWKFKNRNSEGYEIRDNNGGAADDIDAGTVMITGTILILILAAAFLLTKRLVMLKLQSRMNCRRAFDRFIDLMHYGGYLDGLYGSERGFADKLCEEAGWISPEQAHRLISVLEADNYSREMAGEDDTAFVRELYRTSSEKMYASLPWHKKLIFKFIKNFN